MQLYNKNEIQRAFNEGTTDSDEYRSHFRRDFARVIHSHGIRRLAGKTQLFPCGESDFFRNRLTHSLEVAQIAKTIALKLNQTDSILTKNPKLKIDLDLVELAGIAHDLGHPPFGHQGEEMLAECMYSHGGFEGNAQTLRLLTKIEKKVHDGDLAKSGFDKSGNDMRFGLNLTFRSLASVIKYDSEISNQIERNESGRKKIYKGYYETEKDIVSKIKECVTGKKHFNDTFKTIECSIMDIADDITYSTYDLEDAFKAGFISPIDMLIQSNSFYETISNEVSKEIGQKVKTNDIKNILSDLIKFMFELPDEFILGIKNLTEGELSQNEYMFLGQQYANKYNQMIVRNGYVRTNFSSQLIKASVDNVKFVFNEEIPSLSTIDLDLDTRIRIEILKRIAFMTQVLSPKLKSLEHRGKAIIEEIFHALTPKNGAGQLKHPDLLPDDFKNLYSQNTSPTHKYRTICDFIACMTDKYALDFYAKIKSVTHTSIFIPPF